MLASKNGKKKLFNHLPGEGVWKAKSQYANEMQNMGR
jgi:hypothetical protein